MLEFAVDGIALCRGAQLHRPEGGQERVARSSARRPRQPSPPPEQRFGLKDLRRGLVIFSASLS